MASWAKARLSRTWSAIAMMTIVQCYLANILVAQSIPCDDADSSGSAGKYWEMIALSNGDFLACGESPDGQGTLARFDPFMRLIWHRGYQFGSGPTLLYDVVENSQGNLVAAGSCQGWTPGMPRRGMLLYVDGNGAMLASTPIFVSSDSGEILSIENALDGSGYVVAEHHTIPWFSESRISLVDAGFTVAWSTLCDGYGQYTRLQEVTAVPGKGYYATGITGSAFQDNRLSYWKIDSTGTIDWEREYVSDTIDLPHSGYALAWDASTSTLLLGGTVYINSTLGNDYCLFRVDPDNGNLLDSSFGGLGWDDRLLEVQVDANGTIYGAGYTSGDFWFGLTASDATVIAFDANLQVISTDHWEDVHYPNDAWVIEGLALDPMGSGCMNWVGYRTGTLNGTLLFGSCSGPCVSLDARLENRFSLYPNPAVQGAGVRLSWDDAILTGGTLQVYTMDGRLVHAQTVQAGDREATMAAPIVAGLYLVQIQAGNQWASKRLMVD